MKSALRFAGKVAVSIFHKLPFLSGKYVREAYFDTAEPNTLLLSKLGDMHLIVSSSDKVIGRGTFTSGAYDFDKFEKAISLIDKPFDNSLIIDIGANIGTICITAVKRGIFKSAIAVEPDPFNFSLLAANIHINGLADRVSALNMALGAAVDEELTFEFSESNYGDHRIRISSGCGMYDEIARKTAIVKSKTFDQAIGLVDPKSTLVWMDTQGFEGFVLKGAKNALSKKPPLVIEFWPYGMKRSGSYKPLKQAILDAGYSVFYDLDAAVSATAINDDAFDDLFRNLGEDGKFTDLLIL